MTLKKGKAGTPDVPKSGNLIYWKLTTTIWYTNEIIHVSIALCVSILILMKVNPEGDVSKQKNAKKVEK